MKKVLLMLLTASTLSLAACDQNGQFNLDKQTIGTGVGALGGGLLGSQVGKGSGRLWATGAGVLLGGLAGSAIGSSLDKADRMYADRASAQAQTAPIGTPITWNNPQSGNSGTIVPVNDGHAADGRYCREYQQTIVVGGQKQSGYGKACQQPDGSWQIVN